MLMPTRNGNAAPQVSIECHDPTKGTGKTYGGTYPIAYKGKGHQAKQENGVQRETAGALPYNIDKGGAHKPSKRRARTLAPGHEDLFGNKFDPHDALRGLKREFTFPPFSVLNSKDGLWIARKRLWWNLGVKSENKRGVAIAKAANHIPGMTVESSLSLYDPVLCELMIKWFCRPGGIVLDPFCGFSIGGIVASCLGRRFVGVDISAEQVKSNQEAGERVCGSNEFPPVWLCGDSANIAKVLPTGFEADMLLGCPPYADLEQYSENPSDISTMKYAEFLPVYQKIIRKCVRLLKPNSFAAWVVGEVRDKSVPHRPYFGFVQDTITAFKMAGMEYYNDVVLLTAIGSLPLRTRQAFIKSRKVGHAHQSVLIFVKGDPKLAAFPLEG